MELVFEKSSIPYLSILFPYFSDRYNEENINNSKIVFLFFLLFTSL